MSNKLIKEKKELLVNAGYSNEAIEYFINEVNVGIIENADVSIAYTGSCGYTCKVYLIINNQGRIEDAKILYLGCPACAICGSIVTQMAKGKTLQKAENITQEEVIEEIRGLPNNECHCAKLAITTLKKAIKKFQNINLPRGDIYEV